MQRTTSLRISFFKRPARPVVLRFYAPHGGKRLLNFTLDPATGTLADIDVFHESRGWGWSAVR
jgi:hypothetical protein